MTDDIYARVFLLESIIQEQNNRHKLAILQEGAREEVLRARIACALSPNSEETDRLYGEAVDDYNDIMARFTESWDQITLLMIEAGLR
jgi:hypothetical protein